MIQKITSRTSAYIDLFLKYYLKHYIAFSLFYIVIIFFIPWFVAWRYEGKDALSLTVPAGIMGVIFGALLKDTISNGEEQRRKQNGEIFVLNGNAQKLMRDAKQYLEHLTPQQTLELTLIAYLSIIHEIKTRNADILIRYPETDELKIMNDALLGIESVEVDEDY